MAKNIRLHMGCFDQVHEGWVNTDITPNILIAKIPFAARFLHAIGVICEEHFASHKQGVFKKVVYMDVTKRLPYANNSVECVFCSHILEHLYPLQVQNLMEEIIRVLKPGGVFRISVPSLDWVVSLYDREDPYRFLNYMYELDIKRPKNSHKWMYSEPSLMKLFMDNGFREVVTCEYRHGRLPEVEKMDSRAGQSIFVEGLK